MCVFGTSNHPIDICVTCFLCDHACVCAANTITLFVNGTAGEDGSISTAKPIDWVSHSRANLKPIDWVSHSRANLKPIDWVSQSKDLFVHTILEYSGKYLCMQTANILRSQFCNAEIFNQIFCTKFDIQRLKAY